MDRVPDELWMEARDIVQQAGIKTISEEKQCQKAKQLSEEALQIAEKREVKGKGENKHLNAEFQGIARRDKKTVLSDQCKEREENNRMGKTRELFKKITLQTSLNLNIKVSVPHCLDHIGTSFVYCPISLMDTHHQI